MVLNFVPSTKTEKYNTRFVNQIGTGLNGRGILNGPRMQVSAVINAISVICFVVRNFAFVSMCFVLLLYTLVPVYERDALLSTFYYYKLTFVLVIYSCNCIC